MTFQELTIYSRDGQEQLSITSIDYLMPSSQRPVPCRLLALPLQISSSGTTEFLMRIRSKPFLNINYIIQQRDNFEKQIAIENLIFTACFAIIVTMLLYNLVFWFFLGDLSHLLYVFFFTFNALFLAHLNGLLAQFVWFKYSNQFDPVLSPIIGGLAMIFGLAFTQKFFVTIERFIHLGVLLRALLWLVIMFIFVVILQPLYRYISLAGNILAITIIALVFVVAINSLLDGYRPAVYFIAAHFSVLIGTTFFSLSAMGIVPENYFTKNANLMGIVIESVLMSLALASRVETYRSEHAVAIEEKYSKEKELATIKESFVEHLEEQVAEKTKELSESESRYRALIELSPDILLEYQNRLDDIRAIYRHH